MQKHTGAQSLIWSETKYIYLTIDIYEFKYIHFTYNFYEIFVLKMWSLYGLQTNSQRNQKKWSLF